MSYLLLYNRKKSVEYVGHLIGHEGKGSFLSALKVKGYASEVIAGVDDNGNALNSCFSVFSLQINLTIKGNMTYNYIYILVIMITFI
jgi:nardilysin